MTEYRRADRPADEADEKYAKCLEHADQWSRAGKKQFAEHEAGDCAVEQEVNHSIVVPTALAIRARRKWR